MPSLEEIFNLGDSPKTEVEYLASMLESAKFGYTHRLDQQFRTTPRRTARDKAYIIVQFLRDPHFFNEKEKIISFLLESPFDAQFTFERLGADFSDLEVRLWKNEGPAPDTDLIKAKAILLAEFIRLDYCKKDEYNIPFAKLANEDGRLEAEMKSSLIATQNALVDYIAEKGPALILNRGAAILHVMRDETDASVWAKKISDLKIQDRYSILKGVQRTIQPVFQ